MLDFLSDLNRSVDSALYSVTGITLAQIGAFVIALWFLRVFIEFDKRIESIPVLEKQIASLKEELDRLKESTQEDNTDLIEEVESLRSYTRGLDRTSREAVRDLVHDVSDLRDRLHVLSAGMLVRQL